MMACSEDMDYQCLRIRRRIPLQVSAKYVALCEPSNKGQRSAELVRISGTVVSGNLVGRRTTP
jgi:hypothetical protein